MSGGGGKETKRVVRAAEARGWIADITRSGHVRLRHPETGATVIHGGTPGRGRAHQNFLADIRRAERNLTDSGDERTMAS